MGHRSQKSAVERSPKRKRSSWQIFLDSLSTLCDHKSGGETVTAIVVERGLPGASSATFWIATNNQRPRQTKTVRARDHLDYILQELQRITLTEGKEESDAIMLDLFDWAVYKAKDKVNTYRKKLQSLIANAKKHFDGSSSDGSTAFHARWMIG